MLGILLALMPPGRAQVYIDYLGAGHSQGIQVTTSSQTSTASGAVTVSGAGIRPDYYEASRFLGQATFGASYEDIAALAGTDFEDWIEDQYARPQVSFLDTTLMIWAYFKQAYIDRWGAQAIVNNQNIQPYFFYWRMAWWHNIMHAQDPLRQRVALALSEIMVVSEKSELDFTGLGLASYYDVLYRHALGNYRDLLYDVTLHPAMGFYLDHINNPKSNPANNTFPDENYAREVMQLFTIGLYELNPDGTHKLDASGNDIPSYDNDDIDEFAKIFTGLGPGRYYNPWTNVSAIPVIWGNGFNGFVGAVDMTRPMQMFNSWHEPGPKYLLNGQVVPAGQTGMQDIEAAVDNLFNHPNVGPFIGRQLIQRLVKSNPSPAYVARVAAAFADNGQGVRGDMQAVVKAVLLDPEARDCAWIDDPSNGKLREPLVRALQLFKAFDLFNASGRYWNTGGALEAFIDQHPLASPSVFNFFLPDFQPNGPIADAGLFAPEFQIHNSRTAVDYYNYMYFSLLADYYMEITTSADTSLVGFPNTQFNQTQDQVFLDLGDEVALAQKPLALADRLDLILTGGGFSEATKTTLANMITTFAALDPAVAVKVALYLVTVSPDYNIQR
ncbi:MAG: hypothetical protein OHK0039_42400 [Bacteroidia bacterium]